MEDADSWDEEKLAKLSGLLMGLPPRVIRKLPGDVLLRNLDGFTSGPLTDEQGRAVMDKVDEHDP